MKSEKKEILESYSEANHIYINVEVDFYGEKRILKGLLDTGSTESIISKEIVAEYIKTIEELEKVEITGVNGKGFKYKLKDKHIVRIDKYHREESGFKMQLYTMQLGDDVNKIDMILGLSFLKECISFWLDARNYVFKLEFFS